MNDNGCDKHHNILCSICMKEEAHESEKADLRRLIEEAQAERDRLKGELAEARRLLRTVASDSSPAMDAWDAECDAFLAATPAEQAQGEGAQDGLSEVLRLLTISRGHMDTTILVARHAMGNREPAEQAPQTDRLDICARPGCYHTRRSHTGVNRCPFFVEPAEQAQGEAAPNGACARHGDDHHCNCYGCCPGTVLDKAKPTIVLDDVNAQVAALAKRVEALEVDFGRLAQDSATQGCMVDLQNKVAKLEERCDECGWPARAIMHGDNTGPLNQHAFVQPAPPAPEAAVPGLHEFEEKPWGGVPFVCYRPGCWKVRTDPIHAVPPIAEGVAR